MTTPADDLVARILAGVIKLYGQALANAAAIQRIEQRLDALTAAPPAQSGPAVASDAELDSQWGDPTVRKDPKKWPNGAPYDGPRFEGQHYSQATPEYLEALAGFLQWSADKDEKTATDPGTEPETAAKKCKYAGYARKDAARALGWARRMREGWKRPDAPPKPTNPYAPVPESRDEEKPDAADEEDDTF